jgi:hypothetical protein
MVVVAASLGVFLACTGAQPAPDTRTTTDLRTTVEDFHLKMRWGMWEQAAAYVAPEYLPSFEARYDELGDDFKISNLDVRKVTNLSMTTALIDVEQEAYKEPEMTVKTERYIEDWRRTANVWRLHDRVEKDEWEKRQKEKVDELEEKVEAADAATEADANDGPEPQPNDPASTDPASPSPEGAE